MNPRLEGTFLDSGRLEANSEESKKEGKFIALWEIVDIKLQKGNAEEPIERREDR